MKVAESTISKGNHTMVPKPIREALQVEAGDRLEWHVQNNFILVKKSEE